MFKGVCTCTGLPNVKDHLILLIWFYSQLEDTVIQRGVSHVLSQVILVVSLD